MSVRLAGLLGKELIQFFQDRLVLALILWLYTVEVVLCTYALSFEVDNMPIAVVDQDGGASSRSLVEAFDLSQAFDVALASSETDQAITLLSNGTVGMVLVIPRNFEYHYRRGDGAGIQLLLDGSDTNSAANARHYAREIVNRFERRTRRLPETTSTGVAVATTRTWYNPAQTTTAFMALSMIALAGMMVGVIHPAASIVREKERGTLEQLLVSPIRPGELFAAKTFPAWLMGMVSLFPSLLIVEWFDVPLRGSFLLFLALTGIFLLSAIGLGVLIATVSRTLQQALLLSFFGLFPIMFLSGSLTPVESMPRSLQILSLGSPLRYYMDIILGIFLKGAGWRELWQEALMLTAIGAALYIVALGAFRRRIV